MKKALWMATTVMAILALLACARPTATPVATPTRAPVATPTPALRATPTPALVVTPRLTPTATPRPAPTPTPLGRQEALVAGARKEGTVVYWSTSGESAPIYLKPFLERYPFLQLRVWDARSTEIAEKVIAESKAGRHSVDVVELPGELIGQARAAGLLERYEYPNTASWPAETQTGEGFYANFAGTYMGPAYNSKLVSPAEAPKSWEDLKNPKWKDKAVASLSAEEAPLLLAGMWGREGRLDWDRSFAFWREVFQNIKPRTVSGYTGPIRLLGAGEYELFVYTSAGTATKEKLVSGLPVELVPVDRLPAKAAALAIVKNALHPNAARLLADYETSTEGQIMFANTMWQLALDPKAATQAKSNRLIMEKGIALYIVPSSIMTGENVKKSSDFWQEMLGVR